MIDVYGMSSPNVLKITIALEELALAYRQHYVNVFGREQYGAQFLAISPLAKVPVIVDEDGPGGRPHSVFESGAILLYLAEKTGRLLPHDAAARSTAIQWLTVQLTTVGPMFGQLVHFTLAAPPGNDYARERYTSQVKRVLEGLERRLGASEFLGGPDYGMADVATWPWIRTGTKLFAFLGAGEGRASLQDYPRLRDWYARVGARPAVERGAQAGERFLEQDQAAFAGAGPEGIDRFFERGKWAR
jgi:GST-like protein